MLRRRVHAIQKSVEQILQTWSYNLTFEEHLVSVLDVIIIKIKPTHTTWGVVLHFPSPYNSLRVPHANGDHYLPHQASSSIPDQLEHKARHLTRKKAIKMPLGQHELSEIATENLL